MIQAHDEVERSADAAAHWTDGQIVEAVRRFVFDPENGRPNNGDAAILRSLGSRTHPEVLRILRDPKSRTKLTAPTREDLLPEAPLNRICDLLGDEPPAEALPLLAGYLDDESHEIRKDAALVIGAIGTDAIIAPMRKALADPDEFVRSHALIGLMRAVQSHRLSGRCSRELFGDLQKSLSDGRADRKVPSLLLAFDRARAVEFFLSDVAWADGASRHTILESLNAEQIVVPRDRLLGVIERISSAPLKYPRTYELAEALQALGRHRLAQDLPLLETRLSSTESVVARGAAQGLVAWHGLDGFQNRLWKTLESRGVAGLTAAQRRYKAVLLLDGEVNNGGFSQFFFNSSGDEWRAARDGLEAMGSTERLSILREALALFGEAGPSENRERRMKQLSDLAKADETLFDALETRYYSSREVVDVLATLYVIRHRAEFP